MTTMHESSTEGGGDVSIRQTQIIYDNNSSLVIRGDVFDGIEKLKELSIKVNCIVTSPPYW